MAAPLHRDNLDGCVFDAYGTLFDIRTSADRCGDALGERKEPLLALWRVKQLEYSWLRSLRGDFIDFWHVTGESLDYAMAATGTTDPLLRSRLMAAYLTLEAYADAKDTLSRLRAAGLKTAILSNGSTSMVTAAVNNSGLHRLFDWLISVDEVHAYKPHPSVYRLATERLQCAASRICFLSANAWDASGAAHFGFRVVWLKRDNTPFDLLPGKPEGEIPALAALPDVLGV
ncbi:MAG: haloacid dehalogenase type II [Defluviicoccus sp.]